MNREKDRPPRVLHLAFGNLRGGAARGAWLLHKGLLEAGADSRMLVTHRPEVPDAHGVDYLLKSSWTLTVFRLRAFLLRQTSRTWRGSVSPAFSTGWLGTRLWADRRVRDAEVIHLHWVCGGMLSTAGIGRLRKPVVWTLRDMWPFTGGCHYSGGCERYAGKCGRCPLLASRVGWDRSRMVFRQKARAFARIPRLHPVGISPWIAAEARRSGIFAGREVEWIWNGVDLGEFPYTPQSAARHGLGLDPSARYFATGALDWKSPHKGFPLLQQGLGILRQRHPVSDFRLLVFGRGGEPLLEAFPGSIHFGRVEDAATLNRIYAAADAFVAPSGQEAFGKTLIESLASGTPVVCFDAAGPRNIVDHKATGYKAAPHSPESLADGMEWIAQRAGALDEDAKQAWRRACSTKAEDFSHHRSARGYAALYRRIDP